MTAELFLSNDNNSYFLRLLVNYLGADVKIVTLSESTLQLSREKDSLIKFPSLPFIVTKSPSMLTQLFAIAGYISELSFVENFLVGETNLERAEIISAFELGQKLSTDELVQHYTKQLETRIFLVSKHITLADLFLFSRTYEKVSELTDTDKQTHSIHFFRWFNHIQHLPRIREFLLESGRVLIKPASPFAVVQQQGKQKKQK